MEKISKKKEKTKNCPKCGSTNVDMNYYLDVVCTLCNACGYDQRDEYDMTLEEKTNQKEKADYSPYKQGGSRRTAR